MGGFSARSSKKLADRRVEFEDHRAAGATKPDLCGYAKEKV